MPDAAALYIYLGVFLALVAAGLGAPIPEEIPVVTAGALIGHAATDPDIHLRWWIMLPVCILGVVISDGLLYGIGRLWGPRLLENRWVARMLPAAKRHHIERNFRQYGVLVLLFARFLPAIRSPIFITAGMMRVSLSRFLLADGLYAIPGVSLLFVLAYHFTDEFKRLVDRAEKVRSFVVVFLIAGVAAFLVYHFFRQPVVTGDPRELAPFVPHAKEPAKADPPIEEKSDKEPQHNVEEHI
jgi:membrane protein DedA with SNARE-associated domain